MRLKPSVRQTAYGMVMLLAAERCQPASQRIVSDDLALGMLPLGLRQAAWACRWRVVRKLAMAVSERKAHGIYGSILCRKRYGEDKIEEALALGIEQFVFLGAGFDTRGCRLASRAGLAVFETDLAKNVAHKREAICAIYGRIPERLTQVPVDFEADDLGQSLATEGFRPERPTMFICEGVLPYLTATAVDQVFSYLVTAAPGSRFIFSYVRRDFCEGVNLYGNEQVYKRFLVKPKLIHFALAPEETDDFLGRYGWTKREEVGAAEYIRWYLAPANRDLPVSEIERFVYAEKPNPTGSQFGEAPSGLR
jgi:methyltransferase (TIGR00027 family)